MTPGDGTQIGDTTLTLSRLGVGTASLGNVFGDVNDGAAEQIVSAALANGVNYIDTAPLYGNGLSERRLGAAMRALGQPDVTFSTKVGRILDDSEPHGWRFDFTRDGILRSLDSSLERLDRDAVDILYLHDPDDFEDQVYREAWPTLESLRSEGVVRAIGVGMNQWQIPLRLVQRLSVDLVMLAGRSTLLDQSAIAEFLPACVEHKVAVVAAGVFNSGILIDPVDGAWFDYAPAAEEQLVRARQIRTILDTFGVSLPQAALHFAAAQPAVISTVVGVGSAQTLEANIRALRLVVPDAAWRELRRQGLIV